MQKIYFRADASATIGYGHFIRTLALADMLKEVFECIFFTCHPTSYQVVEVTKVCHCITLCEETHFEDFLFHLRGNEIVVLDNYFFTTSYQKQIKDKGCRLVCIDDMHSCHFYCDIVFCPDPIDISKFSLENFTTFFGGIEWAFLRQPFLTTHFHRNLNCISSILLGFGGVDPFNVTDKIIDLLYDQPIQLFVLAGEKVRISEKYYHRVEIFRTASAHEIIDLFRKVDLAILSASTICTEALAVGLPVAAGYYIDNQLEYYHYLSSNKLIYPLGNLLSENLTISLKDIESSNFTDNLNYIDYKVQNAKIINIFSNL